MNKNKAKATSTAAEAAINADEPVEPVVIEGEAVAVEPSENTEQGEVTAIVPATTKALSPKGLARKLDTIAGSIRKEVGKGIEAAFATGRLLSEARVLLPSNTEFGKWLDSAELGISQQTAHRLRWASENETQVREAIEHSNRSGRDIGVATAVKELNATNAASGRVPKETQNAVADLVSDEPVIEADGFSAFVRAAEALDMSALELGDLVELAGIIQKLAADYKAEKARR